ncbi:pectin lyase fold/virulence factor [Mycena amicta]|nr:pectin lyase fold/virulence factor [Mycena amicta]
MQTSIFTNMPYLPLDLTTSILAASLAAIPIPGNPIRYAFLVILTYWTLKYSAGFIPGRRLRALKDAIERAYPSLRHAQSICIFDQAALAYETARLLRAEHLKVELEQDLRDLRRCSWIEYLPATYHLVRQIARCIAEVRDIAHRIQDLVANEKKRKLARAANDAKQDYATLSSGLRALASKAVTPESLLLYDSAVTQRAAAFRDAKGQAEVKYEADRNLAARTGFTWTILRPGGLTDTPRTGTASIGRTSLTPTVSRDGVALALYLLLDRSDAAGLTMDMVGGETPIGEGLDRMIAKGETDFLGLGCAADGVQEIASHVRLCPLALGALQRHTRTAFIECNVLSYGAVADNTTDLGPALTKAWQQCFIPDVKTTVATDVLLYVPAGNFLLKSNVVFDDAANSNLHIAGNLYLPYIPTLTGTMLTFEVGNCQNIFLDGPGAIFGNRYRYRPGGNLTLNPSRPRLIRFQNCNNYEITAVTFYDAVRANVAHDMAIIASHIGETDGYTHRAGNGVDTGKLQISDVTFSGITGSGAPARPGIWLDCNKLHRAQISIYVYRLSLPWLS